jgi:hypothetical protein
MEIEKVVVLLKNVDKAKSLLEQALSLLSVQAQAQVTAPAKKRGRPRKAEAVELDL